MLPKIMTIQVLVVYLQDIANPRLSVRHKAQAAILVFRVVLYVVVSQVTAIMTAVTSAGICSRCTAVVLLYVTAGILWRCLGAAVATACCRRLPNGVRLHTAVTRWGGNDVPKTRAGFSVLVLSLWSIR